MKKRRDGEEMDGRGSSVRVAESTRFAHRPPSSVDPEGRRRATRASDEVAKANRRDSAHVAKKEVKSSLGRKGRRRAVPRKILSTTFSSEIDDSRGRRRAALPGTEERARGRAGKRGRGARRSGGRRIDRVVSLERSKEERERVGGRRREREREKERTAIYAASEIEGANEPRLHAGCVDRSVDEERRFSNRDEGGGWGGGEDESNEHGGRDGNVDCESAKSGRR